MTDRELLELAAKAAGIDKRRLPHAWPERFDDDVWDPLIDDGDALRLAVKLRMIIGFPKTGNWAEVVDGPGPCYEREDYRRAIVRAAAEIGRAME